MKARALVAFVAAATALSLPAPATGQKGFGYSPEGIGITSPAGGPTFYSIRSGADTNFLRLDPEVPNRFGESLTRLEIDGRWAIPAIAYGGETSGISADGGRQILVDPRVNFGRESTSFLNVDTDRMELLERIELRGSFGFDAISPDGLTLYLVRYPDPRDPSQYEVVAYEVASGRLRPEPILDSETAPVVMRGFPITRETTADGVWAFTMYSGGRDPFVHALNTEEGTALCIEFERPEGSGGLNGLELDLSPDQRQLSVLAKGDAPIATIDTDSWEVSGVEPFGSETEASGHESHAAPPPDGGGSPTWIAFPLLALGLGIGGLLIRRRRRPGAGEMPADPLPGTPSLSLPLDEPSDPATDLQRHPADRAKAPR